MSRRLLALGCAALALLLLPLVTGPADARGSHGHSGFSSFGSGGPHFYGGPHIYSGSHVYSGPHLYTHSYRPRFHHHHRRIFVGVPVYYYDDYGYYADCYWLHRRALRTGSPYWWRRYEACVAAY
jgi:hypothetical protein